MSWKGRLLSTCCISLIFILAWIDLATAYGYNFAFPAARRSLPGGFIYADPKQPTHLAWDYRFYMHTGVSAAREGSIATSEWGYADLHESGCLGLREDRGNYIVLNHTTTDTTENTGLETWYFHLSNTGGTPGPGTGLSFGQYMASSGDTGCGEAHLHFAVKNNGVPINPYAGSTHWVGSRPIPMGYRDQNGAAQGPFALISPKIRDHWLALEGSPGAPIGNVWTNTCYWGGQYATDVIQRFELGYIHYCGSGNAEYIPNSYTNTISGIRARYTCGAGENSRLIVSNISPYNNIVTVLLRDNSGVLRDTRVYNPISPGGSWTLDIHHIYFDPLVSAEPWSFQNGSAFVSATQNFQVEHTVSTDPDLCLPVFRR